MDSGRLGRVLGVGARLAGKTLVEAIDAATSQQEDQSRDGEGVVLPPSARREQATRVTRATATGVRRGGKRFGEAVWEPMARASGVLWLEVTGVFFGLVAVAGVDGVWKSRAALHWGSVSRDQRMHLMAAAVLALSFGYFCLSSFLAAGRGSRRDRNR